MDIKIYLTNLAQYNDGRLIGEWLNLSELSEDQLNIAIKRILGNDEEYFITDFEAPFRIEEYSNAHELRNAAEKLAGMNDYEAAAVIFLIEEGNTLTEALEEYESVVSYSAGSFEELAEQFVDEGLFGEIPESIQNYIDYEKIGRDLSFDYTESEYNGQTYFFDRNY
jgi:antirestriction protein